MTLFELITVIMASGALIVSIIAVFFNGVQTRRSTEALLLQQQLERGNAIMHFTSRFFDFAQNGDPVNQLSTENNFVYEFWSLHATEFYFFHHNILPKFMYSLWMIDLAKLYCSERGDKIRELHSKYLNTYSFNYQEMIDFYSRIHQLSKTCDDEINRNKQISNFVFDWIEENKKNIL